MAFKDYNCTCDRYCRCGRNKPCACENMLKDPHCEECLQHLSPGAERAWREDWAKWLQTPEGKKYAEEHPDEAAHLVE
jgi:hypothetical protein